MTHTILEPGMFVRNPAHPDWGLGQVQSRIGDRVTVMFEHEGKQVMNGRLTQFEIVLKHE